MKHISILVPKKAILGSLEGSRQLFTQVNQFFLAKGEPAPFKVQLVGLTRETLLSGGCFTANTDVLLDDVKHTDLIIIPAFDGEIPNALELNKEFIPWLVKQYHNGAEIASLCMGAFILASTGLLAGKKCATHWLAANEFKKMFPDVNLVTEKIITDEQGLYSSGGAFSYLNLILYLIEKHTGREMAVRVVIAERACRGEPVEPGIPANGNGRGRPDRTFGGDGQVVPQDAGDPASHRASVEAA